jgi:hypothetical protein
VCTLLEKKNLSTGIRFKQVILKGFLRLDLQPVQLIFPTSITDKKIHQPSNDILVDWRFGQIPGPSSSLFRGAAGAAFSPHTNRGKLLQHKLIRVQCTKKSTRVPVSPVPQYGYSV